MPDPTSRTAHESALTRAVAALLAEQRQRTERRPTSGWSDFRRQLTDVLTSHLQAVFVDASLGFYAEQGFRMNEAEVGKLAANWATGYAPTLAASMTTNLQSNVADAIDRAKVDARDAGDKEVKGRVIAALLTIFDDSRAENVGITEVTRSITAGEVAAAGSVRRASTGRLVAVGPRGKVIGGEPWERGGTGGPQTAPDEQPPGEKVGKQRLTFVAVWMTMDDEKVCSVCRKLHNKPREEWGIFKDGPPAHPRDRCWIKWKLVPAKRA